MDRVDYSSKRGRDATRLWRRLVRRAHRRGAHPDRSIVHVGRSASAPLHTTRRWTTEARLGLLSATSTPGTSPLSTAANSSGPSSSGGFRVLGEADEGRTARSSMPPPGPDLRPRWARCGRDVRSPHPDDPRPDLGHAWLHGRRRGRLPADHVDEHPQTRTRVWPMATWPRARGARGDVRLPGERRLVRRLDAPDPSRGAVLVLSAGSRSSRLSSLVAERVDRVELRRPIPAPGRGRR